MRAALLIATIAAATACGDDNNADRRVHEAWTEASPATRSGLVQQELAGGGSLEGLPVTLQERVTCDLLEHLAAVNGSSIYNLNMFRIYRDRFQQHGGVVDGARIVEIGPGQKLSIGMLFALAGADRYIGVDIYRPDDLLAAGHYRSVLDTAATQVFGFVPTRSISEVITFAGDVVELRPDRIAYLYPHESYDFPVEPGTIDYLFSNAAFEHFNRPLETVEHIHSVLRPGGLTAHQIDLADHHDSDNPLAFLELSDEEWRGRFRPENMHRYTNRWRVRDFRQAFEDLGFEILAWETAGREGFTVTETTRAKLAARFRDHPLDELEMLSLFVVARKPTAP